MPRNKFPSQPSRAGRKTLLTPEVQGEFFEARRMGLSFPRCAEWAGVSKTAVRNWRIKGEQASSVPANKRTTEQQKYVEFVRSLERVDNEWIVRCETVLNLSMTPGQNSQAWRNASIEERRLATETAKWKLSHQAPSEYSTQVRTEITGAEGGPVEIDPTGMDVWKMLVDAKAYEDAQEDHN